MSDKAFKQTPHSMVHHLLDVANHVETLEKVRQAIVPSSVDGPEDFMFLPPTLPDDPMMTIDYIVPRESSDTFLLDIPKEFDWEWETFSGDHDEDSRNFSSAAVETTVEVAGLKLHGTAAVWVITLELKLFNCLLDVDI